MRSGGTPVADILVCVPQVSSCPRDVALDLLRRVGLGHRIEEAREALPDPIDLDHDQELLARFGLTRGQLEERLGASP